MQEEKIEQVKKKPGRPKGSTKASKNIIWKPQKKQEEALVRNEFEVLYGGARGGGKTDAGMAWLLYEKDNPLFRGLVIRLNAKDLEDWIDRARRMYVATGAVFSGKPTEIRFPSGAVIRTGHLKDENAYTQYQGHEYQRILIEELTQIPQEKYYEQLISSCRSTVPGLKPQIFATTNPGNLGHEWVKRRWGIPDEPTDIVVTPTEFGGRVFIQSKVFDNPTLVKNDPNYVKQLEAIQDANLRNAWLNGSWGDPIIEGAIYRTEIEQLKLDGRLTEVPYDSRYPVYTYWDIGISDATAIGFFQKIGHRWNLIDYYENRGQGLNHYAEVVFRKEYFYGGHFAPHDLEQREWTSGESRLNIASKLGLYFTILPKLDIEDGINAVRMKFNRLWVDKKAGKAISTLLSYHYEWDDSLQKFKNKPLHDWSSHVADMFRYWAIAPEPLTVKENEQEFHLYETNYG